MRTIAFDCGMGAAGDMICAALLELHPEPGRIINAVNSIGLPGIRVSLDKAVKCGIKGSRFNVKVFHEDEGDGLENCRHHHGMHLDDIVKTIDSCGLPEKVISDAKAVYSLLAEAESRVHGVSMEHIHFHEVGTLDAVTDVLTACLLIYELAPELVYASPVNVGSGTVKCAHGILPVPAPAAAELLRGIPCYSGETAGELCTPTGAALLRHFVGVFGKNPVMRTEKIGCGMGHKDFEQANTLRVFLGETEDTAAELKCNVDDMTGEEIGYAVEALMRAGALDASWQCVGMKKNRPGFVLSVICRTEDTERMTEELFRHTRTIGIREELCRRYVLKRGEKTIFTEYGPVRVKCSEGYGVERAKAEFDDLRRIAEENDLPLSEVKKLTEL